MTVEVGADLGLDIGGIGGGIGVSVATETIRGTTTTSGEECQGPWSCGLLLIPNLMRVTGKHTYIPDGEICTSKTDDYTIDYPVLNPDGSPTSVPMYVPVLTRITPLTRVPLHLAQILAGKSTSIGCSKAIKKALLGRI